MLKSLEDVQRFMNRERLASFATVGRNGEPRIVPVFFTYDVGRVYIQTDRDSVKVRNLSRDNRVAVAVYRGEEAVIIRGTGRFIKSEEEFVGKTREHIAKYRLKLDEHGRDSLGIPLFNSKVRCVVEVVPRSVRFW